MRGPLFLVTCAFSNQRQDFPLPHQPSVRPNQPPLCLLQGRRPRLMTKETTFVCWVWWKGQALETTNRTPFPALPLTGCVISDHLPSLGFPDSSVDKKTCLQCRRPQLIPGLGRSAGEGIGYPLQYSSASLAAQLVKNVPAMREIWVWSLSWENPLEKGKVTHSSILAWRIPWTIQSMGSQRVGHNWMTFTFTHPLWDSVGEGEGGMFQENSIETCILSRVKQITSPGWMHETSARTWCTGKT